MVVLPGLFDVAGELLRVQPNVAYDSSRSLICVFNGCVDSLRMGVCVSVDTLDLRLFPQFCVCS